MKFKYNAEVVTVLPNTFYTNVENAMYYNYLSSFIITVPHVNIHILISPVLILMLDRMPDDSFQWSHAYGFRREPFYSNIMQSK